jgi:hypothetical protein
VTGHRSHFSIAIATRVVLSSILCAVIAWQAVVLEGVRWLIDTGSAEDAAELNPYAPDVAFALGEKAISMNLPALAHADAALALRGMSINQPALTLFALTSPNAIRPPLMALSAGLGWRDLATQISLAQTGIQHGSASLFAQRFDAYERQVDSDDSMLPLLDRFIGDPSVRDAIVSRLAARPRWRLTYLQSVSSVDPGLLAARLAMLSELFTTGAGASRNELSPYISRLVVFGAQNPAYEIWRRFIARPDAWSGLLYDGHFEHVDDTDASVPFEWTLADTPGGYAAVDAGARGNPLHLHSEGGGNGPLIRQTLMLRPGRYQLMVQVDDQGDALAAGSNGFSWSITCDDDQLLGDDGDGIHTSPGRHTYAFSIPKGCQDTVFSLMATSNDPSQANDVYVHSAHIRPAPVASASSR